MDESNNTIFTHAKIEYTAQLIEVLTPNFFDGIKSIYDESKNVYRTNNPNNTSKLILFRLFLEKVPTWSSEVIETETNRIILTSNCDWLNDLITAVFISHTKILTAIGSNNNSNIELIIPKTINFIHKCYINIAREIWKNPYLFDDFVFGSEYQMNMRTVELLIKDSIENTIRKALPVKEILKQQLDIYDNINNDKSKVTNDDIRKMLLEEIKSLKNDVGGQAETPHDGDEAGALDTEEGEQSPEPVSKEGLSQSMPSQEDPESLEEDVVYEESKEREELRERINNMDEKFKMDLLDKKDDINEEASEVIEGGTNDYETTDGYVSPDEEEIKNKCENLSINTIPDLDSEPRVVEEENYDNVDIYSDNKENNIGDKTLLESYLDDAHIIGEGMFIDDNTTSNIKENITEVSPQSASATQEYGSENTDPFFKVTKKDAEPSDTLSASNVNVSKEDPSSSRALKRAAPRERGVGDESAPLIEALGAESSAPADFARPHEGEGQTKGGVEDKKKEEKEIISVNKNDDTETVDLFFEDVSNMLEKKGIDINKDNDKYTLFEDAIIEEAIIEEDGF